MRITLRYVVCLAGCATVGGAALVALPHGSSPVARRSAPRRRPVATVQSSGRLTCRLRRPRFRTLPALRPTGFCLALRRGARRPDQDLLITPRPDPRKNAGRQFALMLLSPAGRLLWYEQRPTKVHDLKVIHYHGRPALAFFQQDGNHGYYELRDERYQPIGRVTAGHGYSTNLHELQPGADDTFWVSADVHVPTRRDGTVVEYVVQRVDPTDGRVLFEWHSLRHVTPASSYERRPAHGDWDYFHGNSIAPPTAADPTVVVSSRNTSSLYGVDPASGRTRWILGGKHDQFGLPPRWRFCAQHDVHRLPNGDIELFDNGGADLHGSPGCPEHPARAMVFRLDPARHRVRLVRSLSSQPVSPDGRGFHSAFVGSARPLSHGGTIVDWGQIPRVSLFGRDGREDAMLRLEFWSYRAVAADWTGRPPGAPAVVARRAAEGADVWASWNGATAIRRWQVLAGTSAGALSPAGQPVPFADLETRMQISGTAPFVAVRALGAGGRTLGQSATVAVR